MSIKNFEKLLIEASGGDTISYLRKSSFSEAGLLGKIGIVFLWFFFWPVMLFVHIIGRNSVSSRNLSESDNRRANMLLETTTTNLRQ